MIRIKLIIFVTLFTLCSNCIFSQTKNRISIQTGLFHYFFDKTSIINNKPISQSPSLKRPYNLFGGYLNDSGGLQYERTLDIKSSISADFMILNIAYFGKGFTSEVGPFMVSRRTKQLFLNYKRNKEINDKAIFVYSLGVNYNWGLEQVYLYSTFAGFGWEPKFHYFDRSDFGVNTKIGFEYSIFGNFMFYTNINFLGYVYLGAKDINGVNAKGYYQTNYQIKNIPNRFDLSLNFGLGFNF